MISKLLRDTAKFILIMIAVFVPLTLVLTADWYIQTYGNLGFNIVVYQLMTPLQGAGKEYLDGFFKDVLTVAVTVSLLCSVVFILTDMLFERHDLTISFRRGSHSRLITLSGKKCLLIKRVIYILGGVTFAVLLINRAVSVGIPTYISQVIHSSTIYEDEYVDPRTVEITFPEAKNNLILLYMESMTFTYADYAHSGPTDIDYIPELTQLAEENVNFSTTSMVGGYHPYDMGFTTAGIVGSTAGVNYQAAMKDSHTMKYYTKILPGVYTLGQILEDAGYSNYFLCGSDAEFSGRGQYFEQHGNSKIMDLYYAQEEGYIPPDYHNGFWGFEDKYLYEIARSELADIATQGSPFCFAMLTVDTHGPAGYKCDLCEDTYSDQMTNAIRCSSKQAFDFVNWIKEQDWYQDTTIVIMGDHEIMAPSFMENIHDYEASVYDCIINSKAEVTEERTRNREFCTVDLFPTILAAMGAKIDGERLGLGTNLFSDVPTLPEELGREYFENQLTTHSNYYQSHFIRE